MFIKNSLPLLPHVFDPDIKYGSNWLFSELGLSKKQTWLFLLKLYAAHQLRRWQFHWQCNIVKTFVIVTPTDPKPAELSLAQEAVKISREEHQITQSLKNTDWKKSIIMNFKTVYVLLIYFIKLTKLQCKKPYRLNMNTLLVLIFDWNSIVVMNWLLSIHKSWLRYYN